MDTQQLTMPDKKAESMMFSAFFIAANCRFSRIFAQIIFGLILDFLRKSFDVSSDK